MTVVIAGCGQLGTQVGLGFAAEGYRVLGLRRSPARLPAPIEGRGVDLRRQVPRLPRDTAIVVVALTADARAAQAYRDTFVTGLDHLLDAINTQVRGTPATLLVSSTSVYGVSDGSWVDEDSPAVPSASTAVVLREAEQLLLSRLPGATVLRLAGLYGGTGGSLLATVRDGTATATRTPTYTNRIHRADATAAILHLATRTTDRKPIYLGVDHEPAERGEVLRFLAAELGVPPPEVVEEPSERGRGKRCRNDQLCATGFTFAFPTYREGYRSLIESGAQGLPPGAGPR